jgi:hypothetical protein
MVGWAAGLLECVAGELGDPVVDTFSLGDSNDWFDVSKRRIRGKFWI